MRKLQFAIIIVCMLAISCQKQENKKISLNNIHGDIEILGNGDLSATDTSFLKLLGQHESDSDAKTLAEDLVEEEYTYGMAFDTIEKYRLQAVQILTARTELHKKIADTCSLIHQKIIEQKHLRDSINSFIYPKINIARKTTLDYYLDAIEFDCNIRNHNAKTIRYLSFDFLLMKDDTLFARIPCELNIPIKDKIQHDFIFDDRKHARIYQTIELYGLPFYKAGYQVKKIIFQQNDTLAIDMQFYDDTLLLNPKSYHEEKASDDCPYLRNTDSLYIQQALLDKQTKKFLEMSPSVFTQFWERYMSEVAE